MVLVAAVLLSSQAAHPAAAQQGATPEFFAAHRERLLARLPAGAIEVFHAAPARGGAATDPYRQDSDFWYLAGLDEPEAIALFQPGAARESRYSLFVQPKDFAAEQWTGWRAGVEGAQKGSDPGLSVEVLDSLRRSRRAGVERLRGRRGRAVREQAARGVTRHQRELGAAPAAGLRRSRRRCAS
jgi:Xaa-Pro aminopeptidase